MTGFRAALWAEALKVRRSKVPWLTALAFTAAPLVGGLFMVILQDPERARSMGLLGAKAQLSAGSADWPTYLALLAQAMAIGGAVVFALVTSWVFGREFADRTAKELLALPASRGAIVAAKFTVIAAWALGLTAFIFALGLVVGTSVGLPGSPAPLVGPAAAKLFVIAGLTLTLMSPVALLASLGRGYLPAMGWAILTIVAAQIVAALGWGAWFPWSVPALYSGLAGPLSLAVGPHSFAVVLLTSTVGLAGTFAWWRWADQVR